MRLLTTHATARATNMTIQAILSVLVVRLVCNDVSGVGVAANSACAAARRGTEYRRIKVRATRSRSRATILQDI